MDKWKCNTCGWIYDPAQGGKMAAVQRHSEYLYILMDFSTSCESGWNTYDRYSKDSAKTHFWDRFG